MSAQVERKKNTVRLFQQKKQAHEPISMLTAYDYPTARLVEQCGVDTILVGDSLGMVVLGYENTIPVTMDEMLHHCKAVARGAQKTFLIGDMPFLSYQVTIEEAVHNAGRFMKEAGMDAVKIEGGRERVETVRALTAAGIPVLGHLGLTPQSIHKFGGFRTQGSSANTARKIYDDAISLDEAGCFAIVLEAIPYQLGEIISKRISIPTIGIGGGAGCDGQVLVLHDILGFYERRPKFSKMYFNLAELIKSAVSSYKEEVDQRLFPDQDHSSVMSPEELAAFLSLLEQEN